MIGYRPSRNKAERLGIRIATVIILAGSTTILLGAAYFYAFVMVMP